MLLRSRVVLLWCLLIAVGCGGAQDPDALMSADDLKKIVPALDGWHRGAITGQTIDVPEVASVVTVSYTRSGGGQLDLEISDTAGKSSMIESLASMAGSEFNREMASGYLKGTTVAGAPAVESWNTDHRIGELTVLVNKRYIIHVGGKNIADAAPMRAVVERIALSSLR